MILSYFMCFSFFSVDPLKFGPWFFHLPTWPAYSWRLWVYFFWVCFFPRYLNNVFGMLNLCLVSQVTFVVTHFNDPRISSADLRDLLLQSISVLVQYKEYLAVFESNEAATQRMPKALLSAFDNRSWIPVTNILLRLCKGSGFGSSKHGESSSSVVFQVNDLNFALGFSSYILLPSNSFWFFSGLLIHAEIVRGNLCQWWRVVLSFSQSPV